MEGHGCFILSDLIVLYLEGEEGDEVDGGWIGEVRSKSLRHQKRGILVSYLYDIKAFMSTAPAVVIDHQLFMCFFNGSIIAQLHTREMQPWQISGHFVNNL